MLWNHFWSRRGRPIDKWVHYFPVYERYFRRFVNTSFVFWEIGVQNGGSTVMWKEFFGPFATIVGIDIDPRCVAVEDEQCHIRIGNQADEAFLKSIVAEFGTPDVILDDGSHIMDDVNATFAVMYPLLNNNGVYLVEDMHTSYWDGFGGGLGKENTFIEKSKKLVDNLNAGSSRGALEPCEFTNTTFSVGFYESMVVFEKIKRPNPYRVITKGNEYIKVDVDGSASSHSSVNPTKRRHSWWTNKRNSLYRKIKKTCG